jgi:hypothetical protein
MANEKKYPAAGRPTGARTAGTVNNSSVTKNTENVKTFRPGAYRDRLGDYLAATGRSPNEAGNIVCPSGEHEDLHPSCKVYADGVHCFACGFHEDVYGLAAHDIGLSDCRGAENWRRASAHIEKTLHLPCPLGDKLPGGGRSIPLTKSAIFLATAREKETELERAVLALSPALSAGDADAAARRGAMLTLLMGWYGIDIVCNELGGNHD